MKNDHKGKKALVCAASKGIGLACARKLREHNADVTVCSRTYCDEFPHITCDLTDPISIENMCKGLDVSILVLNTGGPPVGGVLDLTDDDWLRDHNNLFLSTTRIIAYLLPKMLEKGYGRITSVLSITAKQPSNKLASSSIYRNALISYFKLLSKEVADKNVMVNSICPDNIATQRLIDLGGGKETPIGRRQSPEEFSELVNFLCSEECTMLGNSLLFDGGSSKSI